MNSIYHYFCVVSLFFQFAATAQNEAITWYFGTNAGLSFSTNPPTVLTNGALATGEGCATISGPTGNLFFYTDGSTIWNASHTPMANGTGLTGNSSTTQSAIIVRQPGSSTIYHVFTLGAGGTGTLSYSTVDMSLAAGSGSVIVKNVFLSSNMTEKMTGARHCNGADYWVITHEGNTSNFKTYLVTSAGVSVTPVISATGPTNVGGLGTMKSSPNGRLLASSRNSAPQAGGATSDVFSFDQTSGQITFQYSLNTGLGSYGCEFSPDGTKLYIGCYGATRNLSQFDMCAGSATAVAASVYSFSCSVLIGAMQVAPDGKVYCARQGQQVLGVINNPNLSGPLCNFVELGLSVAPKSCQLGLPNFAIAYTPTLPPFTHTMIGCTTASFTAPPIVQNFSTIGCTSNGYSVTSTLWNFGDSNSGTANTSTLINPQHIFTSPGTYTTTFIVNYSCGGVNDTLKQIVTVANSAPSLSVTGTFTICKGDKRIYTATGANTYSLNNTASNPTVALTPTITTTYTLSGTNIASSCPGNKIFTIMVRTCTPIAELSENKSQLKVYPNPVNNLLYIENTVRTNVVLLNQQGEILKQQIFEPGLNAFDISAYEDGIYFLRSLDTTNVTTRRLVKIN